METRRLEIYGSACARLQMRVRRESGVVNMQQMCIRDSDKGGYRVASNRCDGEIGEETKDQHVAGIELRVTAQRTTLVFHAHAFLP